MSDTTPDISDDNLIGRHHLTLPGNLFTPPIGFDIPVYRKIAIVTNAQNGSFGLQDSDLFVYANNRWMFVAQILEAS